MDRWDIGADVGQDETQDAGAGPGQHERGPEPELGDPVATGVGDALDSLCRRSRRSRQVILPWVMSAGSMPSRAARSRRLPGGIGDVPPDEFDEAYYPLSVTRQEVRLPLRIAGYRRQPACLRLQGRAGAAGCSELASNGGAPRPEGHCSLNPNAWRRSPRPSGRCTSLVAGCWGRS